MPKIDRAGRRPSALLFDRRRQSTFDFDSAGTYRMVNEVPRRGGSFDGPGSAIVGRMLFVRSGYARAGGIPGNVLLAFSIDGQ